MTGPSARDAVAIARGGAWLTLAGAVLSGPLSLVAVTATHPQPAWRDAATFVAHFHPLQTLPFFLGFVLVGGLVTLVVGLGELAPAEHRTRARVAQGLGSAFAALVCLNYAIQTTFVPLLAGAYRPADAPVVAAFTMANPRSLGWCLEMWAYAVVGAATWLVAPAFQGRAHAASARRAVVANGIVSVGAALATAWIPGWALTPAGITAFMAWNALVVAIAVFTLLAFGRPAAAVAA